MWELYTGQVAYADVVAGSAKVLGTVIGDGVRPEFPQGAPSWYITLADSCWSSTPKTRPTFERIIALLSSAQ